MDPFTAVCFGSVQDFRAKKGEINPTLLLWDHSPVKYLSMVQRSTGLSKTDIENKLMNF